MSRYQRYSTYRPSGVAWIPQVPIDWLEDRAKFIFKREQRPVREEDEVVTAFRDGEVVLRRARRTEGFTQSVKEIGYQGVRVGDLVIHAMDGFAGAIGVSKSDGKCTPVYSICTPQQGREIEAAYYGYLLRDMAQRKFILALARGIRERSTEFRFGDFRELVLPVPDKAEQEAIATFLDRETSKIDALIQKKHRLIALLNEKRSALISRAVTKGLDPGVPMRASGVEWIGNVPAHWEVKKVWMIFELGRGRVISHDEIHQHRGPYPVYSSQTANEGVMGSIDTYDFSGDYLTWTTDGARAGTVFARTGQFNCTNVCGTLKPRKDMDLLFMRHALDQATSWFVRHDINPKLMNNVMAAIQVQSPPVEEQSDIGSTISSIEARTAPLEAKIKSATERLQEYRAALISAAVTGQIDVRNEV